MCYNWQHLVFDKEKAEIIYIFCKRHKQKINPIKLCYYIILLLKNWYMICKINLSL